MEGSPFIEVSNVSGNIFYSTHHIFILCWLRIFCKILGLREK